MNIGRSHNQIIDFFGRVVFSILKQVKKQVPYFCVLLWAIADPPFYNPYQRFIVLKDQ